MENNPFESINSRLDIIEGLVHKLIRIGTDNIDPYEKLTRKQLKESYKISYPTIHNAMNNGALIYHKIGSRTFFYRSDAEKWVKRINGHD